MTAVPTPTKPLLIRVPDGWTQPATVISVPPGSLLGNAFLKSQKSFKGVQIKDGTLSDVDLKYGPVENILVPDAPGFYTVSDDSKPTRKTITVEVGAKLKHQFSNFLGAASVVIYQGAVAADPVPALGDFNRTSFTQIVAFDTNVKAKLAALVGMTGDQVVATGWAALDAAWIAAFANPQVPEEDQAVLRLMTAGWVTA